MPRLGIVGFPNTGKTTLFNALTGLEAPTAPHPFSTTEPNVGVARVPDALLDEAAEVERSAKTVHATLDLLDLPAVARPGHGGGLGSQYLGRLREMDALVGMVRSFEDSAVPADECGTDPVAQAQELMLELTVADHDAFVRRHERLSREATADPRKRAEAEAMGRAAQLLADGAPLRTVVWDDSERRAFRDLAPLTLLPSLWVVNVGEDEAAARGLADSLGGVVPQGDTVVAVSARIEAEATQLEPQDREELRTGLGLGEGALSRVVAASHRSLDLVTFYTLGPKEAHAWTVRRGATAPEAAGKIHTDLERGFIRAEVAPIGEVLAERGWDAAKKAGRVRVEGRDYVVAEGDVIFVRFSV
jgi:GTP-binding protein YchF